MALTLKGEQSIGTKFAADVSRLRLIGVRIPGLASIFKGAFNSNQDLESTFPAANETTGNIAFVRSYITLGVDEGPSFVIAQLPQSGGVKQWLLAAPFAVAEDNLHLTDEVAWDSGIQTDVNLNATTLSFTQPTQVGEHLTLAANYHFAINVDESNDDIIVIQGLKFIKETGNPAPDDETPYYYWGLGTDKWAFFTEDGEYVVTNWTLEV